MPKFTVPYRDLKNVTFTVTAEDRRQAEEKVRRLLAGDVLLQDHEQKDELTVEEKILRLLADGLPQNHNTPPKEEKPLKDPKMERGLFIYNFLSEDKFR